MGSVTVAGTSTKSTSTFIGLVWVFSEGSVSGAFGCASAGFTRGWMCTSPPPCAQAVLPARHTSARQAHSRRNLLERSEFGLPTRGTVRRDRATVRSDPPTVSLARAIKPSLHEMVPQPDKPLNFVAAHACRHSVL